jgi:hypothetical protein
MFEPASRYYALETKKLTVRDADGTTHEIAYKARRFITHDERTAKQLVEHTVRPGERLDNISARYLGDPEQFWRLCDANNVLDAQELEVADRIIKITLPEM